jgi:prepilin-type N-terminal cleavage/methylation domain-containing protein
MRNRKGLSLTETLTSIAILSILIGVMVQIILLYNRVQREMGFLTTATLDAKEIGIKIERYMLISKNIDTQKRINNGYTYIIKCSGDSNNPESEIWYINNNNEIIHI